jgi:hypothetical protein
MDMTKPTRQKIALLCGRSLRYLILRVSPGMEY